MKKKFDTWNNSACHTIFYHVTQGSHRAALYCFYNHHESFSDELIKRILTFIYQYLRRDYVYAPSRKMYEELYNFFFSVFRNNDVDLLVSSYIYQCLLQFFYEKK